MSISFLSLEISGSTTDSAGFTTVGAIAPSPSMLTLAFVITTMTAGNPTLPTLTGVGTWTAVTTVSFNTIAAPAYNLAVWRLQAASPAAERINIVHAATVNGCAWAFVQANGAFVDTSGNGAKAVRQTSRVSADVATAIDAGATLGPAVIGNAYVGVFGSDNNAQILPGGGYVSLGQTVYSTPNTCLMVEQRPDVEGTVVGATAVSSHFAGIALEIVAANVGVILAAAASYGVAAIRRVWRPVGY